jgi:hypothetical protein
MKAAQLLNPTCCQDETRSAENGNLPIGGVG